MSKAGLRSLALAPLQPKFCLSSVTALPLSRAFPTEIMSESAFHSPNPAAETPPLPSNSKSSAAAFKTSQEPQNNVKLFAVQCGECSKWRLIPTEDEYEEIRSKSIEEPFVCAKKPNLTCKDAADIEYDSSRTWVIDKPNIPKTPTGFKRKLVLRKDFSKLDAYYVTPAGKKLRSGSEVARFLDGNPELQGVDVKDFSFAVPKIAEETVPKDVERKGAAKAERRAKAKL